VRASKPEGRRIPSLDGIRAVSILMVLYGHLTGTRGFPNRVDSTWGNALGDIAHLGVLVFFVISGFLITSLLMSEREKTGTISLGKFYLRRVLRIFPAFYALIAALAIATWLGWIDLGGRDFAYALTYTINYYPDHPWQVGHLWSLSIEEQFYLLWPLTFVLLVRFFRMSWTTVVIMVLTAFAFWGWRIYLTLDGAAVVHLYNRFDTRADSLLFGCALAIALKLFDLSSYPRVCKWLAWSLVPISALGIFWGLNIQDQMRWYYLVSPLMGSIPAVICVAALVQPHRTFMHTIYEHPAPVFLGRICYGLYIWHYPVFSLLRGELQQPYIGVFLIGWPIAFGLALASYFLIERRFMRARPV